MKPTNISYIIVFLGLLFGQYSVIYADDNKYDAKKISIDNIEYVGFSSIGKNWSVFCGYYSDGKIYGSHLSGNPPFVHEEKGDISREKMLEIFNEAINVYKLENENVYKINPEWILYEQIVIIYNNKEFQICWQTSPKNELPNESINKLKNVLLKYHIGGW